MDVPQIALNNHHHDGDADLSFEALTFGSDDSHGSHHHTKKDKPYKKKGFKKEFLHSESGGNISISSSNERDKSASSVYVSTTGGDPSERIDVQALLKRLEQFGVVKAYYFKEKQNFGFIQFLDSTVIDAVIDNINKHPFQTEEGAIQLIAERAVSGGGRGTQHGESPQSFGTSFGTNFGIPFSPSASSIPSSLTSPNPAMANGNGSHANNIGSATPSPTPEKPDTILVLKNLPFSLKQDQLQEILMAMNTTAPQSINLHFDNMGVFRGMAFIKYRLLDDAIKVYESLNGYDVGGRKVRVEYKRKNKGQQAVDIPPEWQEEEDLRKLWEQVKDFSNNPNVNEISFTPNLTSNQRKQIHTMAEKLKLTHYSNGENDQRYICIKKSATPSSTTPTSSHHSHTASIPSPTQTSSSSSFTSQNGFGVPIPSAANGRSRGRRDSDPTRHVSPQGNGSAANAMSGSVDKSGDYRSRATSFKSKDVASSAPADINMDWRTQQAQNQGSTLAQSPSPGGVTIAPSRQPKGPDGSKGFSDLYRNARKHACTFNDFAGNAVQEVPVSV